MSGKQGLSFTGKSVRRFGTARSANKLRLKGFLHKLFFMLPLFFELGSDSGIFFVLAMALDTKKSQGGKDCGKCADTERTLPRPALQAAIKEWQADQQ